MNTPSQRAAEKIATYQDGIDSSRARALIDTEFAPYLAKVEELREAVKERESTREAYDYDRREATLFASFNAKRRLDAALAALENDAD